MSFVTLNQRTAVTDEQQYRLLCLAMLPFFVGAGAVSRIWRLTRHRPRDRGRSILAEARAASANALLFAFGG